MKLRQVAKILILIGVWAQIGALQALAQRPGRAGRTPNYDPSTEVRVKGTVTDVREIGRSGAWTGTHVSLKTDGETLDVHLGPTSFLAANQITFAKGDSIEVVGSTVTFNGAKALLAREVQNGGRTLTLRDANGIPKWSRARRGPS